MRIQEYFTHYPLRLLYAGGAILGAFVFLWGTFLMPVLDQPSFPYPSKKLGKIEDLQPLPSLLQHHLKPHAIDFDLSSLEQRLILSLCPKRPDDPSTHPIAHIKIKGSNLSRQILLPGKIGLMFNDRGELRFQEGEDRFWMDVSLNGDGDFMVALSIDAVGEVQTYFFCRDSSQPFVQKLDEMNPEEPYRLLGKARWLGIDLVSQLYTGERIQKIEIDSNTIELSEREKLYWDGSRWAKVRSNEGKESPLAVIRGVSRQDMEIDAWNETGDLHYRFSVPLQAPPLVRMKVDEWFSSIRIRSDKQISCQLEKQCLILREGDWVLKENGRWRVLRRPDAKEQFVKGSRSGDLIVLDSIDAKRKFVQGRLILANRIQGFPVELTVPSKPERKMASSHDARIGRIP